MQTAQENAQRELESLPNHIIRQTRAFHDHMRYFVNKSGQGMEMLGDGNEGSRTTRVPVELKELLDDIGQLEDIGERAKQEILEDADSRNVSRGHFHRGNYY